MATTRLSSKLLKARTHARRAAHGPKGPANGGAPDQGQTYATGSNAPTTGELQLEVSIGRRVKLLRQRLQLTATELAAEAGLSPGMLSKIENGGHPPPLSPLRALAPLREDAEPYALFQHAGGKCPATRQGTACRSTPASLSTAPGGHPLFFDAGA